jgi:hypothetical protein
LKGLFYSMRSSVHVRLCIIIYSLKQNYGSSWINVRIYLELCIHYTLLLSTFLFSDVHSIWRIHVYLDSRQKNDVRKQNTCLYNSPKEHLSVFFNIIFPISHLAAIFITKLLCNVFVSPCSYTYRLLHLSCFHHFNIIGLTCNFWRP